MGVINIILSFVSALFWGGLAGILTTAVLMYLIHGLMNVSKILVLIGGFFMFLFLSFQYTAWIGAGKAKAFIEDAAMAVDCMQSTPSENHQSITSNWSVVTNEYPMLKPFLRESQVDFEGVYNEGVNAKKIFVKVANGIINAYMWRRFFWIIAGSVVFIAGFSLIRHPKRSRTSSGYYGSRETTSMRF